MYEQYQKWNITEDTDQVSVKLALAIPEQESTETPASTVHIADAAETTDWSVRLIAKPTVDVTAEHSVTLTFEFDIDLIQLQSNAGIDCAVTITKVRSGSIQKHPNKTYPSGQLRNRDRIRHLKRRVEIQRKARKQ